MIQQYYDAHENPSVIHRFIHVPSLQIYIYIYSFKMIYHILIRFIYCTCLLNNKLLVPRLYVIISKSSKVSFQTKTQHLLIWNVTSYMLHNIYDLVNQT